MATELLTNQVFSGGLALGVIGSLVVYARRYVLLLFASLRRRLVTDLEVRDGGAVTWFGLWLAHTDYGKRCRRLATTVQYSGPDDDRPPDLYLEPGPGPHVFRHNGTWLMVDRRQEKPDNQSGRVVEWYRISILGSRECASRVLQDARTFALALLSRRHTALVSDGHGGWDRVSVGVPRELASVILPGTMAEDVVERCREFLAQRQWYADRGIPWRLGFLLEGPPRTGKTSLARATAHALGLPLFVLDITSKEFCDRDLTVTLSRVPTSAVVLFEDAEEQIGAKASHVTLSGLRNALDGPLASEGRILFMTTNAVDRLDPALLGEGRMDVRLHIGYATQDQARRMFLRFFPEHDAAASVFAATIPDGAIAPAAIQEHLIARKDDHMRAVQDAHLLARRLVHAVATGGV